MSIKETENKPKKYFDANMLISAINQQNKRIAKLEKEMQTLKLASNQGYQYDESKQENSKQETEEETSSEVSVPTINFSFTSFITTAGIIGLIIGLISFFTYAISNGWIGPSAQIMIGILMGLILFGLGTMLYDSYQNWSIATFGGAIFIEYLSIGFAYWYYQLISNYSAFVGLLIFTVIGLLLCLKYDSKLIAYFSLIGGFIIPLLSGIYNTDKIFTFLFLLLLTLAILFMSLYKEWVSVRATSFFLLLIYQFTNYSSYGDKIGGNQLYWTASLAFCIMFFLIYNISSILFSITAKKEIAEGDILILNFNTFFFNILITNIIYYGPIPLVSKEVMGSIFAVISFLFLIEGFTIKNRFSSNKYIASTIYSLITSGVILLNLGLIMIFSTGDILKLILLALPQWILYAYLSEKTEDSQLYLIYSYVFYGLVLLWCINYINLPAYENPLNLTLIIFTMIIILAALTMLFVTQINPILYGISLIILGFVFCYTLLDYINLIFIRMSEVNFTAILSGMWLIYTLTLYIKSKKKDGINAKSIALFLLIITLLKIAFYDLMLLTGITRIVGFTLFGLFLLIGGLLLKNE